MSNYIEQVRAEQRALYKGRAEGYDLGYRNAIETAKREGLAIRWWKLIIAGLIGFMLAVALEAHAQTAQTTLTVLEQTQVTAEVPCNPTNCPASIQTSHSTPKTVENESLLSRLWNAILRALQ